MDIKIFTNDEIRFFIKNKKQLTAGEFNSLIFRESLKSDTIEVVATGSRVTQNGCRRIDLSMNRKNNVKSFIQNLSIELKDSNVKFYSVY